MSDHCGYCGKAGRWVDAPWGQRVMLHGVPSPDGTWIPVRGRAWESWELLAMGEPWDGWVGAPAYVLHRDVCRNWPRRAAPKARPTAQGHLACQVCGVIDHRVRRYPHGDRCRDDIAVRLSPSTALEAS